MNCETCQAMIIDYRYDELSASEAHEVADHLRTCSDCARAYCALDADLKGLTDALDDRPTPGVQAKLAARVAAAFPEPFSDRLLRWFAFPVPAYQVALAAMLVVGLGMVAFDRAGPEPTPDANPTLIENYDADTLLSAPDRIL